MNSILNLIITVLLLIFNISVISKATVVDMDGNGTVIENVDSNNYPFSKNEDQNNQDVDKGQGRQFITFKTKEGKIYHLIINHDQNQDNVKLLTEVSEKDLVGLAEKQESITTTKPQNQEGIDAKEEIESETEKNKIINKQKDKNKSSIGSYIFIGGIVVLVIGVAYYVKIIKPKKKYREEKKEENDDFFNENEK